MLQGHHGSEAPRGSSPDAEAAEPIGAPHAPASNDNTAQWRLYTDVGRDLARQVLGHCLAPETAHCIGFPLTVLPAPARAQPSEPHLSELYM